MAPIAQEAPNAKYWDFLNPPYDSYTSGTAPHDEPYIVSGLNVRASTRGWVERAPGSTSYEATPTALSTARRTFVYRKWNGDTFIMANEVTATQSKVYKLKVGTDSAFQLLRTSNNSQSAGPNSPTAATSVKPAGTNPWSNPSNTLASDYSRATVSLDVTAGVADRTSDRLLITGFAFSIPTDKQIDGVLVEIERSNANSGAQDCRDNEVYLYKPGVGVTGDNKADTGTIWPATGSEAYASYGGSSDDWNASLIPADVNASGFGVAIKARADSGGGGSAAAAVDHVRVTITYSTPSANKPVDFVVSRDTLYYSNSTESRAYDGTTDRKMGIDAPTAAPTTGTSGTGITAVSGWKYVYAYKNSSAGHISSPSTASASTGAVSNKTVTVTMTRSSDAQVDKIVVYRSTDGGDGIFFKLGEVDNPGSGSATYDDTTADTSLSTQFANQAAQVNYNDPPPTIRGLRSFANRIWGFLNDTVYYSGWEEINTGVSEESFPSGVLGNTWTAPQQVTNLEVVGGEDPALLIFCRGSSFKVVGDTRDTFAFLPLFSNLGSDVEVTGTAADGERVFFRGNDSRIWVTDGYDKSLVSEAVTDDLLNIASTDFAMTVHRFGEVNWLIVADNNGGTTGANGARWYVLDLNTGKWMPPWAKSATYLHSGEVTAGNFVLLYTSYDASSNTIVRQLSISPNTAAWTDANGGQTTYTANAVFALTKLAPPPKLYECTHVRYKRDDTSSPTAPTIRAKTDELNSGVTWANETALTQGDIAYRSTTATVLIEKRADFNKSGENVLLRFEWPAENKNFKLLSFGLFSREIGPLGHG